MLFGQNPFLPQVRPGPTIELRMRRQNALERILSHTGKSIHDVINCPIARQTVVGYYKLSKDVERREEIVELERQWNSLRMWK